MSVRDELQVEHEGNKRRLEQKFEDFMRDELNGEGLSNFVVSAILTAAVGVITLFVSGIGAGVAVIGAAILGVICYLVISDLSASNIKLMADQYGQNEDREDENYLRSLAKLEEE